MKLFKRPYLTYFVFGIVGAFAIVLEVVVKDYKTIPVLVLFFAVIPIVFESFLPKRKDDEGV